MKKRLTWIILVLVCALALSACGCKHETWTEANCESPKTCAECGETEGAPLGHTWVAATCETAKTCETCGKVDGTALGHTWAEATCETAKTCSTCNLTEGEALGHSWQDATTDAPKTCATCALTEGERIITDPRFTTAATAAVQGKWGYTIDVTGEMLSDPNFKGTLQYMLIMELGNDGSMSMTISLVDATAMYAYLTETMYAELEASGLNKEQADAALKEATGMTMEQYVDYMFQMIDFENLLSSFNFNGVYYVEGNQLYSGFTWGGEITPDAFSLDGDTLILYVDIMDTGEESTTFHRIAEEA